MKAIEVKNPADRSNRNTVSTAGGFTYDGEYELRIASGVKSAPNVPNMAPNGSTIVNQIL